MPATTIVAPGPKKKRSANGPSRNRSKRPRQEKGVNRVIIGTAAVRNPELVKEAARRFPGRIAVGLDARDGKVAVEGWAATAELSARELAMRFENAGVAAIIYTDVSRDGMLKGLNLDATIALANEISNYRNRVGGTGLNRRCTRADGAAGKSAGRGYCWAGAL